MLQRVTFIDQSHARLNPWCCSPPSGFSSLLQTRVSNPRCLPHWLCTGEITSDSRWPCLTFKDICSGGNHVPFGTSLWRGKQETSRIPEHLADSRPLARDHFAEKDICRAPYVAYYCIILNFPPPATCLSKINPSNMEGQPLAFSHATVETLPHMFVPHGSRHHPNHTHAFFLHVNTFRSLPDSAKYPRPSPSSRVFELTATDDNL